MLCWDKEPAAHYIDRMFKTIDVSNYFQVIPGVKNIVTRHSQSND